MKETFDRIKIEVDMLLSRYKHMTLMEKGDLYFVEKTGILLLNGLKTQLEGGYTKKSDPKRYGFNLIVKLLNPIKPAQHYSVGIRGRHRQINDAIKVRENLEGEFAVWKNKMRKEAKELADLHHYDDEALKKSELELERRISEGELHFRRVMENFDHYEVRIAGYEHEKSYPYISYTSGGKNYNTHLSIKVPTVLYYEPAYYRSDMSVADFLRESQNAFGEIYYMERGEEE